MRFGPTIFYLLLCGLFGLSTQINTEVKPLGKYYWDELDQAAKSANIFVILSEDKRKNNYTLVTRCTLNGGNKSEVFHFYIRYRPRQGNDMPSYLWNLSLYRENGVNSLLYQDSAVKKLGDMDSKPTRLPGYIVKSLISPSKIVFEIQTQIVNESKVTVSSNVSAFTTTGEEYNAQISKVNNTGFATIGNFVGTNAVYELIRTDVDVRIYVVVKDPGPANNSKIDPEVNKFVNEVLANAGNAGNGKVEPVLNRFEIFDIPDTASIPVFVNDSEREFENYVDDKGIRTIEKKQGEAAEVISNARRIFPLKTSIFMTISLVYVLENLFDGRNL